MRIHSGLFRGKRFSPPSNIPARPTTDIAKEALFNILMNHFDFEEISTLDVFAGTGNISFELYSRGCTDLTLVDLSAISIGFIKKIAAEIKMDEVAKIIKGDALVHLRNDPKSYDFIFAGPPFALTCIDELPDLVLQSNLLKKEGWFVLETSGTHNYTEHPNLLRVNNYGQTHFWFFTHEIFKNEQ